MKTLKLSITKRLMNDLTPDTQIVWGNVVVNLDFDEQGDRYFIVSRRGQVWTYDDVNEATDQVLNLLSKHR